MSKRMKESVNPRKGCLSLTRKLGERISIGDGAIMITVVEVWGSHVKLSLQCPKDISILRLDALETSA